MKFFKRIAVFVVMGGLVWLGPVAFAEDSVSSRANDCCVNVEGKLAQIEKKQDEILQRLAEFKEELNIIKVRVSLSVK